MNRAPMLLALLFAAWAQAAPAQTTTPTTDVARSIGPALQDSSGRRGGILGFVYSGRPAAGNGPPVWADYPVVRHVFTGSPAQAAGLRVGDAIVRVNGREGTDATAYHHPRVGQTYTFVVQRGMQEVQIAYTIVEPTWPASEWTPPAGSYAAP